MEKLRVAIIGQGRSGRDIHGAFLHTDAAKEYFEVAAIVDEIKDRQERAKKEWNVPVFDHYQALFDMKDQIDLVVSGINRGLNVSSDLTYSGTAAAAREAFIHEVPAIAVSLQLSMDNDYRTAAKYARVLGMKYLENRN